MFLFSNPMHFLKLFIFPCIVIAQVTQSYDGTGNNPSNLGAAGSSFSRFVESNFGDGIASPSGSNRLSSRFLSSALMPLKYPYKESTSTKRSELINYWAQFIYHDMVKITVNASEKMTVKVPRCDVVFDPGCSGTVTIEIPRAVANVSSSGNRTILNYQTSFIDGSNVYGTDRSRCDFLRSFVGGKLRSQIDANGQEWPPFFNPDTEVGMDYNPANVYQDVESGRMRNTTDKPTLFWAGDSRANENPGLLALHILFLREHNRRAGTLAARNSTLTDEEIFQRSRRWVIALIQKITYYQVKQLKIKLSF